MDYTLNSDGLPVYDGDLPDPEDYAANDPLGFVGCFVAMQAKLAKVSAYVTEHYSQLFTHTENISAGLALAVQQESALEQWIDRAVDHLPAWASHLPNVYPLPEDPDDSPALLPAITQILQNGGTLTAKLGEYTYTCQFENGQGEYVARDGTGEIAQRLTTNSLELMLGWLVEYADVSLNAWELPPAVNETVDGGA